MLKKIKNPFTFIAQFFREIVAELKQVDYLSRSKTLRYSVFIIVALIIGSVFLIFVDQVMYAIRNIILQI